MVQQTTIDVIGVILDVEDTQSLQLKDGTNKDKRTIVLGDQNDISISATLWGETCDKYKFEIGQICALKSCRISEYNGKF